MRRDLGWRMLAAAVLAPTLWMAGCSGGGEGSSKSAVEGQATGVSNTEIAPIDPATAATVTGRMIFEGAPPERRELPMKGNPECSALHATGTTLSEDVIVSEGGLENVFVYVKSGLEGRAFAVPAKPAVIDNKNCLYQPHVIGVQVGQSVELLNSDPTLHNVRLKSNNQRNWNIGLPFQGMKQTKKFEAVEVMATLKCDVHPWMTGYVGVLNHPYFAVTGTGGAYSISGLPPGDYEIEAWHETYGTRTASVSVGPSETRSLDLTFAAS
ncbi:MAG: hypothetical protein MOGMAGMI_00686 [Candidatus Omnitrophica bacterium]|nr:hypothetical protein [Candidatus Omnitrophota bacterium]